uniref:Uncharacterized protein n=1 Tax=Panagrolaimus sp. ES5 TaxID=591445 RepID=A0AC34G8B9_9BILA
MEEGVDLEKALTDIMEDVLKKAEIENPFKNSIEKYYSYAKMITEPSTLKHLLRRIKKANSKIFDEIQIMEEVQRKEEEKKARDQAEADRNEKVLHQLMEIYSTVPGHAGVPKADDPSLLREEVIVAIRSRKQKLLECQQTLRQLA